MKKEKSIIKRPNLTLGQKTLLELIAERLKDDKPILAQEAVDIWSTKVCRDTRNGIPHSYNPWKRDENGVQVGGFDPLNEWEIKLRSVQWLMLSLGSLVLKGYLKVVPELDL